LDRQRSVGRRPNHLDVVVGQNLQHEIDGHQAVAIDAAMFLLNAQPRVAVGHVARGATVILAEPDVHVMDLAVSVHKLD
jgi:hypothetical protein